MVRVLQLRNQTDVPVQSLLQQGICSECPKCEGPQNGGSGMRGIWISRAEKCSGRELRRHVRRHGVACLEAAGIVGLLQLYQPCQRNRPRHLLQRE